MLKIIPSTLQLVCYVEAGQTGYRLKMCFITKPRGITSYVTTDNVHVRYVLHNVQKYLPLHMVIKIYILNTHHGSDHQCRCLLIYLESDIFFATCLGENLSCKYLTMGCLHKTIHTTHLILC